MIAVASSARCGPAARSRTCTCSPVSRARLGSASANIGNDGVVLDIVSACVVGGVSIYGGAGKPLGAVFGAFFITLISNSLNQLGVSYFMNLVVKGIVIIAFIYLDKLARREP